MAMRIALARGFLLSEESEKIIFAKAFLKSIYIS
jgi:hypothetical protein